MHAHPRARVFSAISFLAFSLLAFSAPGCYPGDLAGQGGDSGQRHYQPDYSLSAPTHRADLPCGDTDPSHLCLAINYVTYQQSSGSTAMVSRSQAFGNVGQSNSIWEQCHIQFFVESYSSVDPATRGLPYQPSTMDELTAIRDAFAEHAQLLIVTTGQWRGSLGADMANAWSVLPSVGPFGVIMEGEIGASSNLIAHELGHYLNLEHAHDIYNAMNPIIYGNSINLTDAQCAEARATAISFWAPMLR